MRRSLLPVATAIILALTATAAHAAAPSEYVDSRADENQVATAIGFRAYGVAPHGTSHFRVRVREGGVGAYWVGSTSSVSLVGTIDIGGLLGNVMSYAYSPSQSSPRFDVRLWDLVGQANLALPAGINTAKDEENPSLSGDYLLFGRGPRATTFSQRVLLYRFSTDRTVTLAEAPAGGNVTANAAAGDWDVYTVCKANWVCNVFRYQLSTDQTVKIPNPDRATYWPTVTTDGTVYYVLGSPDSCGFHTKLMQWNGGAAAALYVFPNGSDVGQMSMVDEGAGPVVYFSHVRCGANARFGIWQIKG
ncbi:MAG: hypothetical protein ABI572_12635 [Actinomycetota bacterium]